MCQFIYKLAKVEAKDEELAETSFSGAWKNKLTLLLLKKSAHPLPRLI